MELPASIELFDVHLGKNVQASVIELTTRIAKSQIDSKWWVLPDVKKSRRLQEKDHHWRWGDRIGKLTNDRWHQALGVQTVEGSIEGAILYWFNTKSFVQPESGSVYVEAIATAPHNRKSILDVPQFRGVGEALLLKAVIDSYNYGFGGRVTLESFNDLLTLAFYENRGFKIVGYDGIGEDRLPMLELSCKAADLWLREEGYLK